MKAIILSTAVFMSVLMVSCDSPSARRSRESKSTSVNATTSTPVNGTKAQMGIEELKGFILCEKKETVTCFDNIVYYSPITKCYYKTQVASVMLQNIQVGDTIK